MVESFLFISFSSVARLRAFPWAQRYHFYLRIPSAWHRVWQRTELNKCLQKVENSNSNNISLIKSFDPLEIIFSLVGTECSDHILPWIIVICECFFFPFYFTLPLPHAMPQSYDCWNCILFISETPAVSGLCVPSFVENIILFEQGARDMTHTFDNTVFAFLYIGLLSKPLPHCTMNWRVGQFPILKSISVTRSHSPTSE